MSSGQSRIALTMSSRTNVPADTAPTYRGFVLAMEQLDHLGWDLFDDLGDPDLSAQLAAQVVADPRYVAAVGPMGSSEAFANAPVFDAAGLLQVSPCASHPDLCRRGYRTFYRLVSNEEVQGEALARVAVRYLGAQRVAVVHDDDAFGTVVADYFTRALERLGSQVAARTSFPRGAEAFATLALEVHDADPDLVFFGVHAHEGALAAAAIRDLGTTVPFLGTDGLKTSFFLGGGDARGEAFHTHSGADFRRLDSAKDFRERYLARWPQDSTYSPEAYDAAQLVAQAVRTADSGDRTAVLTAFRELGTVEGVSGPLLFDPTGERLDAPVSLYRVVRQDGARHMAYQGVVTELVGDREDS